MDNNRSAVKNAADKKQVKKAKVTEDMIRDKQLNDVRVVLNTPHGRRLLWRIMEKCKTFGSVWEPSAKIHYNAGQQDLGHFLLSEVTEADEELLFQMMKENKKGDN